MQCGSVGVGRVTWRWWLLRQWPANTGRVEFLAAGVSRLVGTPSFWHCSLFFSLVQCWGEPSRQLGSKQRNIDWRTPCARASNLGAAALLPASNPEPVQHLPLTPAPWHILFSLPGIFPSLFPPHLVNSCFSLRSQLTCYLLSEAFLTSPTGSTDPCLYILCSMPYSSSLIHSCVLVYLSVCLCD